MKKLSLVELEVESFLTQPSEFELSEIKGGVTPAVVAITSSGPCYAAAAVIAAAAIAAAAAIIAKAMEPDPYVLKSYSTVKYTTADGQRDSIVVTQNWGKP